MEAIQQIKRKKIVIITVLTGHKLRENTVYAGVKVGGTHGNAVPRPAISAMWPSQASKERSFPRVRTFPGRKHSFIGT